MPWRGPEYAGEVPSLGPQIDEWIRAYLPVPDGPLVGDPLELTDEQYRILFRFYGLGERGGWLWRRASVRRSQGWGKSPFLGAIGLAELCGPTQFDGWDARGEPVGRPPVSPWVQVAALSEEQADNTYAAMHAMAAESELSGSVLDVGMTRMYRKDGGGRLEPVSSAAGTRLGQRITFGILDEPHLLTDRNGGKKLAATLRRNAAKMGGRTFESTNAHRPGEGSVAEDTYKAAEAGSPGLLYDSTEVPWVEDLGDRAAVLEALRVAYGDSSWVDLERIADEIADPGTDPDDARRFYLNQLVAGVDTFVGAAEWDDLVSDRVVEAGERIGLGFDGSVSEDSTALYGCTADGFVFEVEVWEKPLGVAGWEVPRLEVQAAVERMFDMYEVGRMFCDPPRWRTEIDSWALRWNAGLSLEDAVVMNFPTNRESRFSPACDRFLTGVRTKHVCHDGLPTLRAHLAACKRKQVRLRDDPEDGRTRFVIVKRDVRKIDGAIAAVLAYEASQTMRSPDEPAPDVPGLAMWA